MVVRDGLTEVRWTDRGEQFVATAPSAQVSDGALRLRGSDAAPARVRHEGKLAMHSGREILYTFATGNFQIIATDGGPVRR